MRITWKNLLVIGLLWVSLHGFTGKCNQTQFSGGFSKQVSPHLANAKSTGSVVLVIIARACRLPPGGSSVPRTCAPFLYPVYVTHDCKSRRSSDENGRRFRFQTPRQRQRKPAAIQFLRLPPCETGQAFRQRSAFRAMRVEKNAPAWYHGTNESSHRRPVCRTP